MTAFDLYRAGRPAEALTVANAALAGDPADEGAACAMGCALVMLGRAAELPRLAEHLNLAAGEAKGWIITATVLHCLLGDGHHQELVAAEQSIAQDSPVHILAVYFGGCARMMLGDMGSAVDRFDWFRRHVRFYAAHINFSAHPLLSMVYRQGRCIAGPDEIDRRLATPRTSPASRLVGEIAAGEGPVLFTCLDDRYFTLFGPAFVEANLAANPSTPLVLHVIGPSEASLERLEALALSFSGRFAASVEDRPLFSTVTYFASARFFVVEQLLARFGRPMISLDGEVRAAVEGLGLASACRNLDFACFGTGRDEPGSVWQASVMWFGTSADARGFIHALQAYCLPELGHPSLLTWQLDQAALLACSHYFQVRGLPLAFGDLRHLLGMPLVDAIADIVSAEAKEDDKHGKMAGEVRAVGAELGRLYTSL
ncbi:hypothetical protein A6A04_10360 [Paramagnetospirillum marisnigri]|uniref:Uncharacterized protein n=1 Tax=Paramagnetospirillum marisnigri TaxID=1285242 RepID=A0A178MX60_9PROT|nr:hypothetical protein [Paramagnetospirillum marisnigri]OAN55958.1 hypothetical protein A6A04_10360 [Paramagnetospirillum marisnigri]